MEDKILSAKVEVRKKVYTKPEVRSERLEGTALAGPTCTCTGQVLGDFIQNAVSNWT